MDSILLYMEITREFNAYWKSRRCPNIFASSWAEKGNAKTRTEYRTQRRKQIQKEDNQCQGMRCYTLTPDESSQWKEEVMDIRSLQKSASAGWPSGRSPAIRRERVRFLEDAGAWSQNWPTCSV